MSCLVLPSTAEQALILQHYQAPELSAWMLELRQTLVPSRGAEEAQEGSGDLQ